MSVEIDTVTIGGIEDRRLVLSGAQVARPLSIGNNWVRLRIAIRMAVDDTGGSVTSSGGSMLWFGVMSNPTVDGSGVLTNGPWTRPAGHFIGMRTASATWTRSVTGPSYTIPDHMTVLTLGQSLSNDYHATATTALVSAAPATIRSVWAVDFTKGATPSTWTSRLMYSTTAADITRSTFLGALELQDATACAAAMGITAEAAFTITGYTVNEATNGPLNAACVLWDQVTQKLRISDLTYVTFTF